MVTITWPLGNKDAFCFSACTAYEVIDLNGLTRADLSNVLFIVLKIYHCTLEDLVNFIEARKSWLFQLHSQTPL